MYLRGMTLGFFGGCLIFLILSVLAQGALAVVPEKMQYQGRLTDDAGNPLDGVVSITFTLYGDSAGGGKIWQEAHPGVTVSNGLFNVLLGSEYPLTPAILNGTVRWLGVAVNGGADLMPLTPVAGSAYAIRAGNADHAATAGHADTADIALNAGGNGWTDAGAVVRLQTVTDRVGIGVTTPYEKLEVDGNIAISSGSDIYFGNSNNRISGSAGVPASLTLFAQADLWLRPFDDVQIRQGDDPVFARFDLDQRMLSLGTTTADEMLHVENDQAGGRAFLKLQTSHATDFGEVGFRIETPQNRWHFRMDDYTNNNLSSGALGLRSQNLGAEVMVWNENGNVGINTTAPEYKLHVNGDAKVNNTFYAGSADVSGSMSAANLDVSDDAVIGDTLFAGALKANLVNAKNIVDEVGLASRAASTLIDLTGDYTAYLERQITVPAAGYILAIGWAYMSLHHDITDYTLANCLFSDSPTSANGGLASVLFLESSVDAGNRTFTIPLQRVFYAPSAGTYTYYMIALRSAAGNPVQIYNRQMDLLFIPTVYSSKNGMMETIGDDVLHPAAGLPDEDIPVSRNIKTEEPESKIGSLEERLNTLLVEAEKIRQEIGVLKK